MEIIKDRYTITELSARLSVTDHALRFYEKEFGFKIPKDERGRRYYTPEFANVMFQIKKMRDEGLEIKAIRKILQSEDIIKEPPPVVDDTTLSIMTSPPVNKVELKDNSSDLKQFLCEFKDQLSDNFTEELNMTKDQLSKELLKTKLELGACVENNMRKLESKLDKHFNDVDHSITTWRERNKHGIIKRLINRII